LAIQEVAENQSQRRRQLLESVSGWAAQNTAESRTVEYEYIWPEAVSTLKDGLLSSCGTLNILAGLSGSGKTTENKQEYGA